MSTLPFHGAFIGHVKRMSDFLVYQPAARLLDIRIWGTPGTTPSTRAAPPARSDSRPDHHHSAIEKIDFSAGFRLPWLTLLHLVDESLRLNVFEIPARCCQRAVTKLSLDHVHRHMLGSELGGVGVPEPVRMNSLLDPCLRSQSLHQMPDIARVDRFSLKRGE
jgi:hypothetical protein